MLLDTAWANTGQAAAGKAALSEGQRGIGATFECEVFKQDVFDVLLLVTGGGEHSLDVLAGGQNPKLRLMFHKTECNTG